MKERERLERIRISRAIRVGRKYAGLRQSEVAREIGISQPNLSRIEHGALIPPVTVWFDLCRLLGREVLGLLYDVGSLDRLARAAPESTVSNHFKLPRSYRKYARSSIRVVRPFLSFFSNNYGERKLLDFCASRGVDSDLFCVLDHSINSKLSLEFISQMISDRVITRDSLKILTSFFSNPKMHGSLEEGYRKCEKNPIKLVQTLISNVEKYDTNFRYWFEEVSQNRLILSVAPNPVMRHFNYRNDTIGSFYTEYKALQIQQVSRIGSKRGVRTKVLQSHFRGADRCVYEFYI